MWIGLIGVLALGIGLWPSMPAWGQTASTVVPTHAGLVRGHEQGSVTVFKGIPYAAPPLEEHRWRAPQPVAAWQGVRAVTEFGHDCMQMPDDVQPLTTVPDEDCLYLNVWRPAPLRSGTALPVLVWIHGGGFVSGGSSVPIDDGSALARQGIVFVSINYRLGRLGFFAHPALLAASEGPAGNFGYMDQIAALQWVQRNIAAFGGDPRRVTIMGHSAGGASVLAMLTSPAARGLFHQAVILSGGGRRPLMTRPMIGSPQSDSTFAADSFGIAGTDHEALTALRSAPAARIVGDVTFAAVLGAGLECVVAQLRSAGQDPRCAPAYQGTPMIDGTIVRGTPEELFRAGNAARVPVLIGTVAAEPAEFFPPSAIDPHSWFGEDAEAARQHYTLSDRATAVLAQEGRAQLAPVLPLLAMGADMTMHEPARFVARQITARGNRAWLYRFTYTPEFARPASRRAVHSGELPFLFGTLEARYGDRITSRDRETALAFGTYVANFVKAGDPNDGHLPSWPSFDPARFDLLEFTLEEGPKYGRDPRAVGVELVERSAERRKR
jgi:para-nitrobenzyl esterase